MPSVSSMGTADRRQAEDARDSQALRRQVADLKQALEDRKVIERAKGIVMKRGNLSEAGA